MASKTPIFQQLLFIPVKCNGKTHYLLPEHIAYIKGDSKTATFFAIDPLNQKPVRVIVDGHNLGYHDYLRQLGFVRVHQSYMINPLYLESIDSEKIIHLHCGWQHERIILTKNYQCNIKALTPPILKKHSAD